MTRRDCQRTRADLVELAQAKLTAAWTFRAWI